MKNLETIPDKHCEKTYKQARRPKAPDQVLTRPVEDPAKDKAHKKAEYIEQIVHGLSLA